MTALSYPEAAVEHPIAPPLRAFARQEKISPTRPHELIEAGEIENYLEGGRRRIIVASYIRYVERQAAAQGGGKVKLPSSNPKAKARLQQQHEPEPPRTRGRSSRARQ